MAGVRRQKPQAMSLHTDSTFIKAIRSNSDLMEDISNRLYSTAIPLPDEELANTPCPFIIVTFDGLNNDSLTKDDMEGDTDNVSIGINITGNDPEQLHTLTETVRETVREYMGDEETDVIDYQFSAGAIQYDDLRKCYWQVLRYQCETER